MSVLNFILFLSFQSLIETISNLLKEGQNAWNDLSDSDRRRVASSLLDGLEESAMLLAHSSGKEDSFTLAEANIRKYL